MGLGLIFNRPEPVATSSRPPFGRLSGGVARGRQLAFGSTRARRRAFGGGTGPLHHSGLLVCSQLVYGRRVGRAGQGKAALSSEHEAQAKMVE